MSPPIAPESTFLSSESRHILMISRRAEAHAERSCELKDVRESWYRLVSWPRPFREVLRCHSYGSSRHPESRGPGTTLSFSVHMMRATAQVAIRGGSIEELITMPNAQMREIVDSSTVVVVVHDVIGSSIPMLRRHALISHTL